MIGVSWSRVGASIHLLAEWYFLRLRLEEQWFLEMRIGIAWENRRIFFFFNVSIIIIIFTLQYCIGLGLENRRF